MRSVGWLAVAFAAGCFADIGPGGGGSEGDTSASDATGSTDATGTTAPSSTSGTTPSSTDAPTATSVDPDTSDSSVETSVATADSGVECPGGTFPAPLVPAEWDGPFVLLGGEAAPCPPDTMPAAVDVVHGNPSGECSCDCDLECIVERFQPGNGCNDIAVAELSLTLGASCSSTGGDLVRLTGDSQLSTCALPALGEPQIVWELTHRVCAGEQDGCVPVPPDAIGPCIRSEGDVSCPGGFAHRIVAGTTVEEPACGPCGECVSEANERCANASVTTYLDMALTCMNEVESVPAGSCALQASSGMLLTDTTPPMCPTSPVLSGLADPVTFCCVM